MWNLKIEIENFNRALANAQRLHSENAEFIAGLRRTATLTGVAPQAGGPRAWAPLVAAGLAPRPSARGEQR